MRSEVVLIVAFLIYGDSWFHLLVSSFSLLAQRKRTKRKGSPDSVALRVPCASRRLTVAAELALLKQSSLLSVNRLRYSATSKGWIVTHPERIDEVIFGKLVAMDL